METTIEKRMRKRMALITNEKNRTIKNQIGTITSAKSFDELKDEREAALGRERRDAPEDERDGVYDSSIKADCISELRRRRIHEMTYHRPYPFNSGKKKHSFWQIEDQLHRPNVLLSPSFSESDNVSSKNKLESSLKKNDGMLPVLLKKSTARVLWKDEASTIQNNSDTLTSFRSDIEGVLTDNSVEIKNGMDDEEDEIMTPVRFKKFLSIEREGEGPGEIYLARSPVTEETVTEISAATQALSSFVTSAVAVMKEAQTPEKSDNVTYRKNRQRFEPPGFRTEDQNEVSVKEQVYQGTEYALQLFKDTAMAMTGTPANKVTTKVPTPQTTHTVDSITEEAELMVTKLGLGENKDQIVDTVADFSLWPSLFVDADMGFGSSPSHPLGLDNKAMLEALVQGGALQRELDGKNVLKLFVDMYQKNTFEKIVHALKELKGLQGLIICRGLDKTRATYRSSQEIAFLFNSTRFIQQLDSVTLLNFDSNSMSNVAMMIHGQPLLYRLQIQLADGTLNGEILGVIATAPRLTHVSFDIKESCSLGTLMNSKTLESVCVNSRYIELRKSHIRTLIYSLQTNFTLTTLDLGPPISVEQFKTLCFALRQNFRLESLRVNVDVKSQEESNIVAYELADLFRENNFLLNVWNYSHQFCDISAVNKREIFDALQSNKTMQEFKFFSEDIGDWKNPTTIVGEDIDLNASRVSTVVDESPQKENFMPYFEVDCAALSPPFDCTNVRVMREKFQSWANKHSMHVGDKRMEL
eukprot:CAMPEP_0116136318 /NCGR_PEP_ID=MMETSP0329-20121206/11658_1 /TAXON_ID=697910 /ORGANISM="Pseudo-nitzschia arenysensis, Strain B593" /LENGTH=754 /DNA_ID=CAMNT_0003631173 /DNA_START=64 /DNA_END=2328 /DNA_ORIENTATION=+